MLRMTAPEGASYEYGSFHAGISQLVDDSTEKSSINNHFSGFGSSSVNSGFMTFLKRAW
jgi:hypothetical protein